MKKTIFIVLLVVLVSSITVSSQYKQTAPYYWTTSFAANYPSMCNMIQPIRESSNCYVQGLLACARYNRGICFTQCAQYVKTSCFDVLSDAPTCSLESNFFKKYNDRYECNRAVYSLCAERCLSSVKQSIDSSGVAAFEKCRLHGIGKCSLIGRQLV